MTFAASPGVTSVSASVHACLGSMVARLAMRIIYEEFLRAYPDFERTESELSWMPSTTFRSPTRLLIAIH
jgi:cytochrome P450